MKSADLQGWTYIAETSGVPLREGKRVVCGPYELALFNLGGEFLAIDNRCPHRSGPLSDGIVSGKSVFCPLHNWKMSLESGCALSGGEGRVKKYPVKTEGDKVYIHFGMGAYGAPETAVVEQAAEIE